MGTFRVGDYPVGLYNCLGDLRDEIATLYLDDVIVFSRTFSEHVDHVRTVLRRLREHSINLFKREVCFLGRIVSKQGYTIDAKGVEVVKLLKYTKPKTIGEVRHQV